MKSRMLMIPSLILSLLLLMLGCTPQHLPVNAPLETYEQFVQRTEGVTCADISAHAEGEAPDCRKLVEAWTRGKERVMRRYPEAASVKMSAVSFYRPVQRWDIYPEAPYPVINVSTEQNPYWVRGVTSPDGVVLIEYAYEAVVEHEAGHAITRIVAPNVLRAPEAIAADPDEAGQPYLFMIACHNTSDDFAGDGPPGNRTGCVQPYSGPIP